MEQEIEYGEWWTAPAESEDGLLIMVTGRNDIEKFRTNKRFNIRVEITLPYNDALPSGMPGKESAELIGEITEAFQMTFKTDPIAVLTGIFTGAGERNWIFYTLSINIFQKKINEALSRFDLLPLTIMAEEDPDWAAYAEMNEARIEEGE